MLQYSKGISLNRYSMPALYRIVPSLNLIYFFGYGECTGAEMLRAEQAASADPLRQPVMRILVDMTAVSDLDIESQDLKNLIQLNSQRNQGGAQLEPTAFIWTSRFAQVLESTFRFLADNLPIQLTVTTTILDGIRWLGLGDQADEVRQVRARLESAAKAS